MPPRMPPRMPLGVPLDMPCCRLPPNHARSHRCIWKISARCSHVDPAPDRQGYPEPYVPPARHKTPSAPESGMRASTSLQNQVSQVDFTGQSGLEHRSTCPIWIGASIIASGLYGFVGTPQPDANFERIQAAYGGVSVAGSLIEAAVAACACATSPGARLRSVGDATVREHLGLH